HASLALHRMAIQLPCLLLPALPLRRTVPCVRTGAGCVSCRVHHGANAILERANSRCRHGSPVLPQPAFPVFLERVEPSFVTPSSGPHFAVDSVSRVGSIALSVF